jgi:hypothetical protein
MNLIKFNVFLNFLWKVEGFCLGNEQNFLEKNVLKH